MRLTKNKLKRIIREELNNSLLTEESVADELMDAVNSTRTSVVSARKKSQYDVTVEVDVPIEYTFNAVLDKGTVYVEIQGPCYKYHEFEFDSKRKSYREMAAQIVDSIVGDASGQKPWR